MGTARVRIVQGCFFCFFLSFFAAAPSFDAATGALLGGAASGARCDAATAASAAPASAGGTLRFFLSFFCPVCAEAPVASADA